MGRYPSELEDSDQQAFHKSNPEHLDLLNEGLTGASSAEGIQLLLNEWTIVPCIYR